MGLKVMVEGSSFLLGVAALPDESDAEREARRRVLELAEEPTQGAARGRLTPTLHLDTATLHPDASGRPALGGGRL